MAQAPVPVELLLAEGVMKRLLELATQLAALYMPAEDDMCLQVPASCMDLSTGHMSLDPGYKVPPVTTLVGEGLMVHARCLPYHACCPATHHAAVHHTSRLSLDSRVEEYYVAAPADCTSGLNVTLVRGE